MKVCHIISAFDRHDTRIFWKQCKSLVEDGYDVTLLVNDQKNSEILENIKIISNENKYNSRIRRILFSRKATLKKALIIDADIYQIHDPEFIPVGLKLKSRGKKVIYDSHEDFPRQILEKHWIPYVLRRLVSYTAEIYMNYALKKFNSVITVTPHIAQSLAKANNNVKIVTNYPIIKNSFPKVELESYIERGNVLCYAGTVYYSSLQENILEAIKNLSIQYLMVGNIDDKYKRMLMEHASWRKVNFVNQVPQIELFKLYNNSSIGNAVFDYSPNLGYRIGSLGVNKIFEYMYHGLPIICTDFVLWKEIVQKYNCGICVNPQYVNEIKQGIDYLIQNKDLAFEMGQNGQRAIRLEYNWDSQKEVYLKLFKENNG